MLAESCLDKLFCDAQKRTHIDCLTGVLRLEAERARQPQRQQRSRVGNQETVDDDGVWPNQRTWPLISRVAFTLANLTTSNEDNRFMQWVHGLFGNVSCFVQESYWIKSQLYCWSPSGSTSQLRMMIQYEMSLVLCLCCRLVIE